MRRLILSCVLLGLLLSSSNGTRKDRQQLQERSLAPKDTPPSPPPSGLSGEALSRQYCGSCHAFVPPERLPKAVWRDDVLPAMGYRLGIYPQGSRPQNLFDVGAGGTIVRNANIFPEEPLLAEADWQKIVQYFVDHAPDTIAPPVRKQPVRMTLPHFQYREAPFAHRPPYTAMVKILSGNRGIAFSDGKGPRSVLTFLTPDLQEHYTLRLPTTPVTYHEKAGELFLTTIGKGILPNDAPDGTLLQLERHWPDPQYKMTGTVLQGLQRPVSIDFGDLNQDDLEDIVVCEFGNHTGRLAWYARNGAGGYTKKVLREQPGAIRAVISDANGDGLPDIYALLAQGDEGIFLYENQGKGEFTEKQLLSFPPLNGSQYFELADFNRDGHDDIVYVCGDNADQSPILKEYHGIYIFLNDGNFGYKKAFFYPMNGAYKAMVRDFDLDGDLDIAAISHFPDYVRYPEESFIYLRNTGNLRFQDYSFPEASNGRWIVMDAGDLDGDGDIDLALGSFVYFLPAGDTTALGKKWLSTSPSVSILENTIR